MKAKWSLRLVILADNEEWLHSTLCMTHLVERGRSYVFHLVILMLPETL